jgi:hypothetical protein
VGGHAGRWVVTRVLSLAPPFHEYLKGKHGEPARFKSEADAKAAIAKATGGGL